MCLKEQSVFNQIGKSRYYNWQIDRTLLMLEKFLIFYSTQKRQKIQR